MGEGRNREPSLGLRTQAQSKVIQVGTGERTLDRVKGEDKFAFLGPS